MSDSRSWRVERFQAKLQQSDFELTVDANRLLSGMYQIRYQGSALSGHRLLRLEIPDLADPIPDEVISEAYARGRDFIVSYRPTSSFRFTPQVYWRAQSADGMRGVELMISMQTDVLDSRPVVQASSLVSSGSAWRLEVAAESFVEVPLAAEPTVLSTESSAPLVLVRGDNESFSYLEMAYPTDPFEFWVQRDAQAGVNLGFRLMHEHLEKGVIRRLRVAAWYVPRQNDMQLAADLYRKLLQAEPPLTT